MELWRIQLENLKKQRDDALSAGETLLRQRDAALAERDRLRAALEDAFNFTRFRSDGVSRELASRFAAALSNPTPTATSVKGARDG